MVKANRFLGDFFCMSKGRTFGKIKVVSALKWFLPFILISIFSLQLQASSKIELSIIEPSNNDCIGGTMHVKVIASAPKGIRRVEFILDGRVKSTVYKRPFIAGIDFSKVVPGDHKLKIIAVSNDNKIKSEIVRLRKPEVNDFGYGAHLYGNGSFFKVWAPSARKVDVLVGGTFNDRISFHKLKTKRIVLSQHGEDWFGFVPGVLPWQKYMFELTTSEGHVKLVQDPYARQMERTSSGIGASVVVDDKSFPWTDQGYVIPRFEDMVIYELHIGTFCGNGDGMSFPCRYVDVKSKIEYLKKLGVNMIQIMPVHEFNGEYSWGYNPSGFFAPESTYQSENPSYHDLKFMINEFHRNGIGVIVDVVYSHSSADETNYLWNFDGENNIYFDWGIGTDWGSGFSFGKQHVGKFLTDNAVYWLDEFHADGLRFDTVNWITKTGASGWNMLRDLLNTVKYVKPSSIMIAENLPNDPVITNYLGFDAQWYVDMHHYLEFELKKPSGTANLDRIKESIGWDGFAHNTNLIKYIESHDEVGGMNGKQRLIQELGGRKNQWSVKKASMAAAILLSSPGVPMLFMGQEFLQDGKFADDKFHSPYWGYEFDQVGSESFALYRDLLTTRWLNPALRSNHIEYTQPKDLSKIITYRRSDGNGNEVLVVCNFSDKIFSNFGVFTGHNSSYVWKEIFNSDSQFYGGDGNVNFGDEHSVDGKIFIKLGKWSVAIFKIER
jgi:1,4-alpha-glucan branching enzyme